MRTNFLSPLLVGRIEGYLDGGADGSTWTCCDNRNRLIVRIGWTNWRWSTDRTEVRWRKLPTVDPHNRRRRFLVHKDGTEESGASISVTSRTLSVSLQLPRMANEREVPVRLKIGKRILAPDKLVAIHHAWKIEAMKSCRVGRERKQKRRRKWTKLGKWWKIESKDDCRVSQDDDKAKENWGTKMFPRIRQHRKSSSSPKLYNTHSRRIYGCIGSFFVGKKNAQYDCSYRNPSSHPGCETFESTTGTKRTLSASTLNWLTETTQNLQHPLNLLILI